MIVFLSGLLICLIRPVVEDVVGPPLSHPSPVSICEAWCPLSFFFGPLLHPSVMAWVPLSFLMAPAVFYLLRLSVKYVTGPSVLALAVSYLQASCSPTDSLLAAVLSRSP